jgi:hypothetical protein
MALPIAKRILAGLGFSVVTFVGVQAAVDGMLTAARSAWAGSLSADVANLIAMAGLNVALSIMAGALVGRVSMLALKRFQLL